VITGGVRVGSGLVLVGTEDSLVIALNAETGDELWKGSVSSEILSVPKVANGRVIVQTVDGKLQALDVADGRSLWIYESSVPALTLRGTGSPLIAGNFVIAGFGNGSVVSVALDNGTLRWDQRVAIPTGRTEIDRIVDIDGELIINENMLLTVSYNGNLVAIDPATGQLRWRIEESSANGLATGFGNIYVANANGHVVAYKLNQETPVWTNEQLLNRRLSAPVTFNNYVVTGDFDGYVHLILQSTGIMAGRFRVDRDGVRAPMVSTNDTLYILGNSGNLRAYQLR
jgi:outer membrane protein assembly factor BamB